MIKVSDADKNIRIKLY